MFIVELTATESKTSNENKSKRVEICRMASCIDIVVFLVSSLKLEIIKPPVYQ